MQQAQAQALLDAAEESDGYLAACQKSLTNSKARRSCQYHAWNDQRAASFLSVDHNVKIVVLTASADGGMPHTRAGNIICIPAYFPEESLARTIKHEMVHIDQRNNPEKWRSILLEEGWTPVEESEIPASWLSRCRLNPDTFAARFWAWEGRFVPLPVFVREDRPELRDVEIRWYDRRDERVGTQAPSSFTRRFGILGTNKMEHPYELKAYRAEDL